jgi:putative membrane protein
MSEPGTPAPNQLNAQDQLFAQLISKGGLAEVDAGKLAQEKASSAAVRDLARGMVQDHSKSHGQLTDLAKRAGIALPTEVDPDQKAMRAMLERLTGAEFDLAYLQGQLVHHQKTVQILEWELGNGQEPQLQKYAAATLPVVLDHLKRVQALIAESAGTAPQGLASTEGGTDTLPSRNSVR